MTKEQRIYICSDSVGETAEAVVRASLRQFDESKFVVMRKAHLQSEEEIREIMEEAAHYQACVVYTLVEPELREMMRSESNRLGLRSVDIMGPMMQAFIDTFHDLPKHQPGLLHQLDDHYFRRVEAIEFAVKNDDGAITDSLLKADLILIGVSRSSKTPLSIFLAHKGFKVANLPLIPEVKPPQELFKVDRKRIIGLSINDAQYLLNIRTERLKAIGLPKQASYANLQRIVEELEYALQIMKRLNCMVVEVNNKSIEETAGLIMDYVQGMTSTGLGFQSL